MLDDNHRFVRVCATADIPDGAGKGFRIGGVDVAVFHSEGKYYATSDICSHEHEHLSEGWLEGEHIECPRHGAVFDLRSGEALSLPATEPIETFPIEIRDGDLWIGMPVEYLKT